MVVTSSAEFEQFPHQNGIKHLLSSPYHPSSNGLEERGVQVFKREMSKFTEGTLSDRISYVLFYNHITPHSTTGLSPAELLQSHRLRCRLDLLKPYLQAEIEKLQYQQQHYSDRGSKYREFQSGENFGSGSKWVSGKISAPYGNVSYDVTLDDGRTFRHHVDHTRKKLDTAPVVNVPNANLEFSPTETETSLQQTDPAQAVHVDPPTSPVESPSMPSSDTTEEPSPIANRYPKRQHKPPDRYVPPNFRRGKM